jgi:hypothetical protein
MNHQEENIFSSFKSIVTAKQTESEAK